MHIIIYESSSHGGCYKYALELHNAYTQASETINVTLLLPQNAENNHSGVVKNLLPDNKIGNKLHFLYRHFINPIILFKYLLNYKRINNNAKTFVLLNDFEQMSAPIWSPLFRIFLPEMQFGVFLHDANRDAYPPSPALSGWCIKQMLKTMHLAIYHGTLPKRKYYLPNGKTKYLQVVHGLYHPAKADEEIARTIKKWRTNIAGNVFIIPGHIRAEKNYELAFEAISQNPQTGLIIAGSVAHSGISITQLKKLTNQLEIQNRVLWIERYLTEEQMSAAIIASDVALLYYSSSFHAQSGILNQVAPLRKLIITGNLPNALSQTVKDFNLGCVIKADDAQTLSNCIKNLKPENINPQWQEFFEYANWNNQVNMVLNIITEK